MNPIEDPNHGRFPESVRDTTALLLDISEFSVFGQEYLEILNTQHVIIPFFPHCGHLDSMAVRKAVPRNLRHFLLYPAPVDYWNTGMFKRIVSWLVAPTFPMSRGSAGLSDIADGIDQTAQMLNYFTLVLSPEGTRSLLPLEERKFLPGVAELVLQTGVPVIPARLKGLEDLMPKGSWLPRFRKDGAKRKIQVIFGPPLSFDTEKYLSQARPLARKEIMAQLKETLLGM